MIAIYRDEIEKGEAITQAIKGGSIVHEALGVPDTHIETGLAHVFFFGDRVFKQYKIVDDETHFIKGLLAPTSQRHDFITHDFSLNQHFGKGVYKKVHDYIAFENNVGFSDYSQNTPHVFIEMEKLDFSENLHEKLLRNEVTREDLYSLGYFTAESVKHSPVQAPTSVNWYELASKRIDFLAQFIEWLPTQYAEIMKHMQYVDSLRAHLEENKHEYKMITGEQLTVSLDNHDENVFLRKETPVFIDVVPPMPSWWYGLPLINLANLVVNVETLVSEEAAKELERGYQSFHRLESIDGKEYQFVKALAYGISVAHFGSLENKERVAEKYINRCVQIQKSL